MLVVRQMGLASSLGGLEGAAAAFRAGLVSPSAAPDVQQMQRGDDGPSPVAAHALPATFGFTGQGRFVALLAEALADLGTRLDLAQLPPAAPVFFGMPSPARREAAPLVDDDEDLLDDPRDPRLSIAAKTILRRAGEAIGWRAQLATVSAVAEDETAFAAALTAARLACAERGAPGALVIAVDSLVDPAVLEEEMSEGRVKTDENATGYMPGEAAVAAWITAPAADASTGLTVRAISMAPAKEGEAKRRPNGRALATCITKVVGRVADGAPPPVLFSDHDGRTATALELGHARHLLAARSPRLADAAVIYPALGFGRTGAASGGLGLAVASRAFERGWVPSASALVLSVSDSGARSAVMVSLGASRREGAAK